MESAAAQAQTSQPASQPTDVPDLSVSRSRQEETTCLSLRVSRARQEEKTLQ